MRQLALVLLFATALGMTTQAQAGRSQSTPAGTPKMTNADIIQMTSAGLSEQIILSSIRGATGRNFDLTPLGLVALKKAGVTDAVIMAMQNPTQPAAPAPAAPPARSAPAPAPAPTLAAAEPASNVPTAVASEDGVYLIDDGKTSRIEAKAPYQTRTGSTMVSKLTLGIKKAKLNAMLPALAAEQVATRAPQFYVHVEASESIGDYYLIAFTVNRKENRRELEVASAGLGKLQGGFAEKDLYLVETKRLQKDIYTLSPKTPLPVGEYALLVVPQTTGSTQTGLTPRKIFDFSVR